MKYKNTGKRILCLLLVVCSILTSSNFNRIETRAKIDEKKLYMDYLAKEEKRAQKIFDEIEFLKGQDVILGYKIIDLDHDGKKELIYEENSGGTKPIGMICTIQDGEVCLKVGERSAQFYRVKGLKSHIVVGMPDPENAALSYYYILYTVKDSKLKKKTEYKIDCYYYDGMDKRYLYEKNKKEISENSFKRFEKSLKQIKLKDYKG